MGVRDFRELRVYRHAIEGAGCIYRDSREWPAAERFGLTGQVLRSSRSVCANIAEAWHKRIYPPMFTNKLSDALGEAAETICWLEIANECGYLQVGVRDERIRLYDWIRAELTLMMQARDRWKPVT